MNEPQKASDLAIDICICTFRRPHIAETMHSLAQMEVKPGWKLRIIVADNDKTASAGRVVEEVSEQINLPVSYIHAPAFNISIARNACLNAASAPLIAFVDDDEIVTPGWLISMVDTMEKRNADIVLGPVDAVYGEECPPWIAKGDFHSTRPVFVEDKIITGYSGNVLIRRLAPAVKGLRFRIELGKSGGEDTAFFSTVYKAGGIISYASEAVITEAVPSERASLAWLLKRYFRCGQTHGILLLEETGSQFSVKIKHIIKALAKAEFCMMVALLNAVVFRRMAYWLLRGTMHAGVVFSIARSTGN